MRCFVSFVIAVTLLLISHSVCAQNEMQLTSISFSTGGEIPETFTCDDQDISPAMAWVNAPQSTQSFSLIMTGHDVHGMAWQHWIVYDIPAKINELAIASQGLIQGENSDGAVGYNGPCPLRRDVTYQYSFVLFALDVKRLDLTDDAPTAAQLTQAMHGHVIAQAQLIGEYTSPKIHSNRFPKATRR